MVSIWPLVNENAASFLKEQGGEGKMATNWLCPVNILCFMCEGLWKTPETLFDERYFTCWNIWSGFYLCATWTCCMFWRALTTVIWVHMVEIYVYVKWTNVTQCNPLINLIHLIFMVGYISCATCYNIEYWLHKEFWILAEYNVSVFQCRWISSS